MSLPISRSSSRRGSALPRISRWDLAQADHLCCGHLGRADALLTAGDRLGVAGRERAPPTSSRRGSSPAHGAISISDSARPGSSTACWIRASSEACRASAINCSACRLPGACRRCSRSRRCHEWTQHERARPDAAADTRDRGRVHADDLSGLSSPAGDDAGAATSRRHRAAHHAAGRRRRAFGGAGGGPRAGRHSARRRRAIPRCSRSSSTATGAARGSARCSSAPSRTRLREAGHIVVDAVYMTGRPTTAAVERIFQKRGWGNPVTRAITRALHAGGSGPHAVVQAGLAAARRLRDLSVDRAHGRGARPHQEQPRANALDRQRARAVEARLLRVRSDLESWSALPRHGGRVGHQPPHLHRLRAGSPAASCATT